QIDKALPAALKAIDAYLAFVDGPYKKLPAGSWRYGRALYDKRFPHYLQTDLTPDDVLKRAEEQITRTRGDMAKLARQIFAQPHKGATPPADEAKLIKGVLDDIAKEHSTPDALFGDAKADVAREVAFIQKKNLLTLPPIENLTIRETPPFMRSIYGVAGFDGAPPLQPQLRAFYYVTPLPKDWPHENVVAKVRVYNPYALGVISVP